MRKVERIAISDERVVYGKVKECHCEYGSNAGEAGQREAIDTREAFHHGIISSGTKRRWKKK